MKNLKIEHLTPGEHPSLDGTRYRALTERHGNNPVFKVVGYYQTSAGNELETKEYQGENETGVIDQAIKDDEGLEVLLRVEKIGCGFVGN